MGRKTKDEDLRHEEKLRNFREGEGGRRELEGEGKERKKRREWRCWLC